MTCECNQWSKETQCYRISQQCVLLKSKSIHHSESKIKVKLQLPDQIINVCCSNYKQFTLLSLLQLLLGPNVVCVATLLLTAVCSSWMKPSITLTADHLVTVVLLSQDTKCWLNYTTTKTQNQVKS